jgi:uncharacterized protein YegL
MTTITHPRTALALGVAVAVALSQLAVTPLVLAQSSNINVTMQVVPPDKNDPKKKDDAPSIEVAVIDAPNLAIDKFSLREDTKLGQPVELKPVSKRDFQQGKETVAIALVIEGWEIWIGNDDLYPEDDPSRYPGVLKALQSALDTVVFKDIGPKGSKGVVITYGDKAVLRVPMGDLDQITGSKLGTQSDYKGTKGLELVKAVELGISELSKQTMPIKAIIVVSDGDDTNPETAKAQMMKLKTQAKEAGIQTFGIIYKGGISNDRNFLSAFTSTSTVNSADNIVTSMKAIFTRMAARQYLTFPGFDTKLGLGLPWDGKPHSLILKIDKEDTDPVTLTLAPVWGIKTSFPWLILVLVVVGALLLIFIGVKVFGAKPAPMPMPVAAPVMATEAPRPAGPAKTVMMNAGGSEDGFPVVGWLVPLNGPQAYQTLRLRSGGTKIGTAPPCDFVINDGFMSTEHCMIQASPQGYALVDGGSTNGCYVNERKVQSKQDLVDNDTVTLGKTNFKFKSIV